MTQKYFSGFIYIQSISISLDLFLLIKKGAQIYSDLCVHMNPVIFVEIMYNKKFTKYL